MASTPPRAQSLRPRSAARGGATLGRSRLPAAAAAAGVALVLLLAACGLNVQTNLPYTPADGVNLDVGSVHVRNLMILSRERGSGFLSGTLLSSGRDVMTGVSGTMIKSDGSDGSPITATVPDPIALGNNVMVVLTERPFIMLKSSDLDAGLDASLVLKFSTAGDVTVRVPVIDGTEPYYATVTPSASGSPSA